MKEIKIKNVDEIIYEKTLKNGLKVYIWPYDLTEEVSLSLTVKYGSIHTSFKSHGKTYNVPNGLAHFLEHVKFNEKKDLTAHDYFYKMGSYTNAYTTYDHTSYEVTCTGNIKDNLQHLLYFVLNPYFTKPLIQKEKGIIVEEAKSTMDNPYNMGYQTLLNNIYINNNKRHWVTGTPEEVKSITIDDVQNVFDAFYHPGNMFLTVTGNVNVFEIEKIVDDFFKDRSFPKYEKPTIINKKEPDRIVKKEEEIENNVTKDKLLMGIKIPRKLFLNIDDLHTRFLFHSVLSINFGTTSEFNNYLLSNSLVDEIYYMVMVEKDQIIIIFEVSTDYPGKVSKLIKEKFNKLEIPKEDFERKNKGIMASTILDYENPAAVNNNIRSEIINYNKIIDNIYDVISKMKVSDGQNIINKMNNYEITSVIIHPKQM